MLLETADQFATLRWDALTQPCNVFLAVSKGTSALFMS
jgi:hypothetical protein